MEFNEKLQQLRKKTDLTQEQLAEELFVSRTAISKWESGKGYPNIESLKGISKFFSVSIDDLLSSEELITLAQTENRSNLNKIFNLTVGILDLMAIAFLFIPFYGQQEGDFVRLVSLFHLRDTSPTTSTIYISVPILLGVLGMIALVIQHNGNNKWGHRCKTASFLLHTFALLVFIATRQPYATSLLFMLLIVKVVLLLQSNQKTGRTPS